MKTMAYDREKVGTGDTLRRILVPVDGSDCSARSVAMARHLAELERPTANIILLCVIPPIPMARAIPGGLEYLRKTIPGLEAERKRGAEEILERMRKTLEGSLVTVESIIGGGHPADEILRLATERKADMIVMGSRGLTGASEFFLGSTSDAVVHYAHCPVLIVR
jgi:nucleotide-binding universal stress UspA family protein